MALEELTKKSQKGKHLNVPIKDDGKRTRKLTRQSEWGSFISVIDNSEEEKSIGQSMLSFLWKLSPSKHLKCVCVYIYIYTTFTTKPIVEAIMSYTFLNAHIAINSI